MAGLAPQVHSAAPTRRTCASSGRPRSPLMRLVGTAGSSGPGKLRTGPPRIGLILLVSRTAGFRRTQPIANTLMFAAEQYFDTRKHALVLDKFYRVIAHSLLSHSCITNTSHDLQFSLEVPSFGLRDAHFLSFRQKRASDIHTYFIGTFNCCFAVFNGPNPVGQYKSHISCFVVIDII